jgi:hypothetical protein
MFCLVKRIAGAKLEDIASRDTLQEAQELAKFFNSQWPGEYSVRECTGGQCTFTQLYSLPLAKPLSESV